MTRLLVAESVLRLFSVSFGVMAACVLGLNKETEILMIERTTTVKDILAFWVLTVALSAAGGYHLLQFCKCFFLAKYRTEYNKWEAWVSFVFDQVIAYMVVAILAATLQAALLCLTGQKQFQWMSLADMYKNYSRQSTGGLACAVMASGSMSLLTIISAHQLFGIYSPNRKNTKCCPSSI